MWLASILVINTLTMLTIAYADRGRPTLKDDERFRNGLVRDLKTIKPKIVYYTLNLKISETLSYQISVNVSMSHTRKCNSKHENQTKNVDEDNLQRTVLTIPDVSEEPQEINTVWINVIKCIEVTVIYVIFFILAVLFILVLLMSYKIKLIRFNSS